jgi:hypothetical protein
MTGSAKSGTNLAAHPALRGAPLDRLLQEPGEGPNGAGISHSLSSGRPLRAGPVGAIRLQSPQIAQQQIAQERRHPMTNGPSLSLAELEQRIAIARDNIRQLIEQAAAFSGAEDEDRNADRIAQQQEELDRLIKQRDELRKK